MGHTGTAPSSHAPTLETPRPGASFSGTIPRQHGAWSVLLLGFALGAGVGGHLGSGSLLLLVALVAAMPARHCLSLCLRLQAGDPRRGALLRWAGAYSLVAVISAAPLLLRDHLWWLAPAGAVAGGIGLTMTLLERARQDRTLPGELAGIIGLSVAAPMAYCASGGSSLTVGLGLWVLTALMFCGGVFHVRQVARRASSRLSSTAYHLAAVIVTLALAAAGWLPAAACLALAPATVRAAWSELRPAQHHAHLRLASRAEGIRRLGFQELAHGVLFVITSVLVFRLQP